MLWLNRPRASRDMSIEIVNDDGTTVAVVSIRTSREEVQIELERLRRFIDEPYRFVVTS